MNALATLASMGFTAIEVPLTQGQWTVIDLADGPEILCRRWFAHRRAGGIIYAATGAGTTGLLYMHAALSGGTHTDHRDGNGLNNRRLNLRSCTHRQNQGNARLRSDNTSGFKGVSFTDGKWYAQIRGKGCHTYLGSFDSAQAAAQAYDEAARRIFGEFAATNAELSKRSHKLP